MKNKINNMLNHPLFRHWVETIVINLFIHIVALAVFGKVDPHFIRYSYIQLLFPVIYLCIFVTTHILTIIFIKFPINHTFVSFYARLPNLIQLPGWFLMPLPGGGLIVLEAYYWSISLCSTLKFIDIGAVHFGLVLLRYFLGVVGASMLYYVQILLHTGIQFVNLLLSVYLYVNCIQSINLYSIIPLIIIVYELIHTFVYCINATYKLINYYDEMMQNKK